jgi:hypothetical protein
MFKRFDDFPLYAVRRILFCTIFQPFPIFGGSMSASPEFFDQLEEEK